MTTQTAFTDLVQLIHYQASVRSDQVAFVFGNRRTTFSELDLRANRVANALRAIATAAQTRVGWLDKNSDTFYEVLFGAAKAGHVLAPVNWRLAPAEVAYIVNDAAAEVLFVGEEFLPLIGQIRSELRTVRHILTVAGSQPEWDSTRPGEIATSLRILNCQSGAKTSCFRFTPVARPEIPKAH